MENIKNISFKLALIFLTLTCAFSLAIYQVGIKKNFLNQGRQSEAKEALNYIYEIEKENYSDKNKYTSCLSNFIAENENAPRERKYHVGFIYAGTSEPGCSGNHSILKANDVESDFDYLPYFEKSGVTSDAFTAIAVGKLCEDCPVDVWSINENKEIVNIQPGIKQSNAWMVSLASFILLIAMVVKRKKPASGKNKKEELKNGAQ